MIAHVRCRGVGLILIIRTRRRRSGADSAEVAPVDVTRMNLSFQYGLESYLFSSGFLYWTIETWLSC